MIEPTAGAAPLLAVKHLVSVGADDRPVRRAYEGGDLLRIRRGAYVESANWESLDEAERYDLRIAAAVSTRRSGVVLSHHSAARVWGLPLVTWPVVVHITEPSSSLRRSKNGVFVHRRELDDTEVGDVDGVTVTSLVRTLVDLACDATFRDAVAALDFARAAWGEHCAPEVLLRALADQQSRHQRRAKRAIQFSTDLAMSPLESLSRVVIAELGFPAPQLQKELWTRGGRRFADFWWDAERVAGESDGYVKVADDRYRNGRSAEEVVWAEKMRENEFSELGIRTARWAWRDCFEPARLVARLRAAGLRESAARPRIPQH